jgi:hypothetical protein
MEKENDPNFAYHTFYLSTSELEEFKNDHKVKIIRRGGVDLPGEYVQFHTEEGSVLRGRVISSKNINNLDSEIEVEWVGE